MASPFVGQMMIASWSFPPAGWAPCDGSLRNIRDFPRLYDVLGTVYGGDGVRTFGLPDLRGRVTIGAGGDQRLGVAGGEAAHTLTLDEMPRHTHEVQANKAAGDASPKLTSRLAASRGEPFYNPPDAPVAMAPAAIVAGGDGGPHENRQPFLALSVFIATDGAKPEGE